LKLKNYNWEQAKKDFLERTDLQLIWLNMMLKTEEAKRKSRERMAREEARGKRKVKNVVM